MESNRGVAGADATFKIRGLAGPQSKVVAVSSMLQRQTREREEMEQRHERVRV